MEPKDDLDRAADSLNRQRIQNPVVIFSWKEKLIMWIGTIALAIAVYYFIRGF